MSLSHPDPSVNAASPRRSSKKPKFPFTQTIWKRDWQKQVALVTTVVNTILMLLLGGLTFSPSWPPAGSIAGWIGAGVLAVLLLASALLQHDIRGLEESERKTADAEAERLHNRIASLETETNQLKDALSKSRQVFHDYDRAIKGALLPLAGILEKIPLARSSTEAEGLLGEFKGIALTMLHETAGTSIQKHAARATLYELDERGLPRYHTHRGRAEQPRDRFEGESLQKIRKLINKGETNWFDVDDEKNSVKPSKGSTYKVVVATSIGRQHPKHGMLTVDSTDKAQLADEDWPIIQSVGAMLAASYRIVRLVKELEDANVETVQN